MKRNLRVNEKLTPFLTNKKPIKSAVGGRGSGKSIGLSDMAIAKMERERIDLYCLREFQESIQDSVHRTLDKSINDRLKLSGWQVQENKIISPHGNRTTYKGAARNPNSIQGAENYLLSMFSEAHTASEVSIDKLLPTILRKPGAQCWFDANPQSSEDPFSKRFITPYYDQLRTTGVYEDDLHYIVFLNWRDNPWWNDEQEKLRQWDYENLPRAKYNWIWEGEFNDSVENALIQAEWFDACIDAHTKLGFPPLGARVASHDPSDEGGDSKGFAMRHGSVFLDVQEMTTGTVNEGADWALGLAIQKDCDVFTWDCDGLGISLTRQVESAFKGHTRRVLQFRGSESPDRADAIFEPSKSTPMMGQKPTKDCVKNKRAQYYYALRERCYKTWRAVEHNEYCDPDDLISFSSDIPALQKLRSEVCRMPVKPNSSGKFELYTKQAMLAKYQIKSPNLADSVMMCLRLPAIQQQQTTRPMAIKPMGRR